MWCIFTLMRRVWKKLNEEAEKSSEAEPWACRGMLLKHLYAFFKILGLQQ